MATLILTALGSAIGGPVGGALGASIGGAIGALAGQAIDGLIFRPGPQSGPRLTDLQVQTSRYGARMPRLYGTIRAAGTVIWSTDLQESSATSGGGKGQPSVTRYSYSASFAVALSARPIIGIGRIWADGNLLRGSAGDFKSPVGAFRVHAGHAGQPVDPLIAADVGPDQAPAYRGCAYAVFEGLQLADFGNRIPSLSFEVIADEEPVALPAIMSDLAGQDVAYAGDEDAPLLGGFAAEGANLREAGGALVDAHGLQWRERDGSVALTAGQWADRALAVDGEIRFIDGEAQKAGTKRRAPIETVPARLAIRHHDPARDYQVGVQTAQRPGPGMRGEELDVPAVLSADEARRLADRRLRAALRGRSVVARAMGWAALDLGVGDVVALEGEPGRWLVEGCDWDDMAVRLRLRGVEAGTRAAAAAGDPGEAVLQPDLAQGPTSLAIAELPPDGATLATAPCVLAGATGADAGWRRAALFRYRAEPEAAEPIGPTVPRAVLGTAESVLGHGQAWRIDRRCSVEIRLDNAADALVDADEAALLAGANLCQIGEEVLQFGRAVPMGAGRYRLSHLIRGWHGTEWASGGHLTGERFILLEPDRLAAVDVGPADAGRALELRAIGSGDAIPAEAARPIDGRAMLPPAPVHGRLAVLAGGDIALRWVRRSRLGWAWADGGDAPLGEEREAYLLRVTADGVVLREWEAGVAASTYTAGDKAADLVTAGATPLRIEVRQTGTWGLSRPLVLDLP